MPPQLLLRSLIRRSAVPQARQISSQPSQSNSRRRFLSLFVAISAGGCAITGAIAFFSISPSSPSNVSPHHLGPIHSDRAFDNPDEFRTWTILERETTTADTSILTLVRREQYEPESPPCSDDDLREKPIASPDVLSRIDRGEGLGCSTRALLDKLYDSAIWAVEVKHPALQVSREYTPLPPVPAVAPEQELGSVTSSKQEGSSNPDHDTIKLQLFLRNYKSCGGEVSAYLHSLPIGASVELRGPKIEVVVPESSNTFGGILFLAGGTGIAAAIQLATAIWRRGKVEQSTWGSAPFTILWSARDAYECSAGLFAHPSARSVTSYFNPMSWFGRGRQYTIPPDATQPNALTKRIQQLQADFPSLDVQTFPGSAFANGALRLSDRDLGAHLLTPSTHPRILVLSGPENYVSHFKRVAYTLCSSASSTHSRMFGTGLFGSHQPQACAIKSLPIFYPPGSSLKTYDSRGRILPNRSRGTILLEEHGASSDRADWLVGVTSS